MDQPRRLVDFDDGAANNNNNRRRTQGNNEEEEFDLDRRVETNFTPLAILKCLLLCMIRNSNSDQGLSSTVMRKQIRRYVLYCTVSVLVLITIISVLVPVISFLSASAVLLPVNSYDRAKVIATEYVPFVEYANYLPFKLSKVLEWKQFDSLLNLTQSPSRNLLLELYKEQQLTLTTNIPNLKVGNVSILVLTTGGNTNCNESSIFAQTVSQLDIIREQIVKQHSSHLHEVHASSAITKLFKTRKISVMTHIDGGHTIRDSLEVLQFYYTAGARIMSLASQQCPNKFIQSSNYKSIGGFSSGGLSTFGKKIIIAMNKLGMVIDLAHSSENAITSTLSVSFAPIIISSTGSKFLSSHEDNLSDEVLLLIKENQGLVIISHNPLQLSNTERVQYNKFKVNSTTTEESTMKMIEWELKSHSSRATINDIIEHIDYVKTITNTCDHVGIGYGFENPNQPLTTSGAETSANHMSIASALIQKGYDDVCVKKIMGLNFLRVLAKVENVAKTIVGQ